MSVVRCEKDRNFTVMSNYHLQNKTLSLKAKGLLSFMLSLPDDWKFSISGLCAVCKENNKAIKSTLDELREHGYLIVNKFRDTKGQYVYDYIIIENPDTQKGGVDERYMEDGIQINTNTLNTNNKDKIDKPSLLKNELVNRGFINNNDLYISQYNDLFDTVLNEYSYSDVIKVCDYILDKWKDNNGLDENGNKILSKYAYFKISLLNNLKKINTFIEINYD
ncbi:MAG: hypothetical protein IKF91_02860 [Bacilli bacterium]|nr:hypothetical protein [Bacilli bacterium]